MNHGTPGLSVHHQLPEFTQTHVHWVSDAIQPSHPRSSPSSPAPNPSQHQSFPMSQLFAWGGQSIGVSALVSFLPKNTQGWCPLEYSIRLKFPKGAQADMIEGKAGLCLRAIKWSYTNLRSNCCHIKHLWRNIKQTDLKGLGGKNLRNQEYKYVS